MCVLALFPVECDANRATECLVNTCHRRLLLILVNSSLPTHVRTIPLRSRKRTRRPTPILAIYFFHILVDPEAEPVRRSSRAIISQHKQLTLVIMIVGLVLIVGLVAAQGDYHGNRDDLVFPGPTSRGEKLSPAPANKFGDESNLSVSRCTKYSKRATISDVRSQASVKTLPRFLRGK